MSPSHCGVKDTLCVLTALLSKLCLSLCINATATSDELALLCSLVKRGMLSACAWH